MKIQHRKTNLAIPGLKVDDVYPFLRYYVMGKEWCLITCSKFDYSVQSFKYSESYTLRRSIWRISVAQSYATLEHVPSLECWIHSYTEIRVYVYAWRSIFGRVAVIPVKFRGNETSCYRACYFALGNLFRESLTCYGVWASHGGPPGLFVMRLLVIGWECSMS